MREPWRDEGPAGELAGRPRAPARGPRGSGPRTLARACLAAPGDGGTRCLRGLGRHPAFLQRKIPGATSPNGPAAQTRAVFGGVAPTPPMLRPYWPGRPVGSANGMTDKASPRPRVLRTVPERCCARAPRMPSQSIFPAARGVGRANGRTTAPAGRKGHSPNVRWIMCRRPTRQHRTGSGADRSQALARGLPLRNPSMSAISGSSKPRNSGSVPLTGRARPAFWTSDRIRFAR